MMITMDTKVWTVDYINALKNLFRLAGFLVDEEYQGENGDLAICALTAEQSKILYTLAQTDIF